MDLTPETFVDALERTLAAWCEPSHVPCVVAAEWRAGGGMRTHIMKGDAIRKQRTASQTNVLKDVLATFGYRRWQRGKGDLSRVYFPERHGLDLVAIECPNNWDDDCWRGSYRTVLTIELENDLQEFDMTMRSLLDVRSDLSCGIFYLPAGVESVGIGVGHRKDPGRQWAFLDEWRPAWFRQDWSVPAQPDERQLAIFLSANEPRVVEVRCYGSDGSVVKLR